MKIIIRTNLAILLLICFSSCDPELQTCWKVENTASQTIEITHLEAFSGEMIMTSTLESNEVITLSDTGEIGDAEDAIANWTNFPFEKLTIVNSDGDTLKTEVENLDNWTKTALDGNLAEFKLVVKNEDF